MARKKVKKVKKKKGTFVESIQGGKREVRKTKGRGGAFLYYVVKKKKLGGKKKK